MYRKFLLALIAIVGLSVTGMPQQTRVLDWQDFKTSVQKTDVADPVKWGTFTIFQINGISKFLYKVNIAGKSFELQTPIPSELQTLFRLTPSELQKNTTNAKTKEAENQTTEGLNKASRAFQMTQKSRVDAGETDEGVLEQALNGLQASYQLYLDMVKQISADVLSIKRSRNQLISIAQKDLSFAAITAQVADVNWPIASIESDYNDVKTQYTETSLLVENVRILAADNPDVKPLIDAMAANLKKAEALIEEESLLGIIDEVNYLYTELQNENNFKVNAPPVQMDGDLISYEVTITPASTKSLAPFRNPMKFTFDIPAKGGLKVDFSVGPVVSFGSDSKDEKYFLEETSDADTVLLRTRPNKNGISPGIGAFMHVYPHSGRWASVGGVFGIGAGFQNTSEVNFSLYLGLTAVLGKSQKVMGSIGAGYLRVQRIKDDQFVINKKYAASKIEVGQVTEAIYRPSVFVSVSYSLSARIETK